MLFMQAGLQAVREAVKWVMCFSRTVVPRVFGCFVQKVYVFFLPECHFPLFLSKQGFC